MEYSKEIKKKAISYANAVASGNITLFLQAEAKYMSPENQVILLNFLADFDKEIGLSKRFENWLRQKGIEQANLFEKDK
jgi:hypothetical protein